MQELERSIARGVAWTATGTWVASLMTFAITVVLARLLEPRAFGLVALAAGYIGMVRVLVDQGFATAIIQRQNLEPEHLDTTFWVGLAAGSVLAGTSMLVAGPVALAFGQPEIAPIIRWLSLSLMLTALHGTQEAILQRELAFRSLAIRTLIATVVGGFAGIGAAVMGYGAWSLVVQTLISSAVATAVVWRASPWRPGFRLSRRHFGELFGFSSYIFGTNVLNVVSRRADDLLIGWILGPIALGFYTVAYELVRSLTDLLAGVTTKVALPAFSRLQQQPERMKRGFYAATRYTSLIAFPAFAGMILVAPEFVRVFYGAAWEPAIPVMQILSVIGILQAVYYFNGTVMLAAGKASWRFAITLLAVVGNVIAFFIAVRWGIVAVAAAFVIRGYLLAPLPLWALGRLIGVRIGEYLVQHVIPVSGVAVMTAGVLVLRSVLPNVLPLELQLAAYVLAGAALYAATVHVREPSLVPGVFALLRRPEIEVVTPAPPTG